MSEADTERALSLITPALVYDRFNDVDIVIEAVPEQIAIKKAVLRELEAVVPETTIFASNTSALSISELASATGRPTRVIGMHFFNPAHIMRLVAVPGRHLPRLDDAGPQSLGKPRRGASVRFSGQSIAVPYLDEAPSGRRGDRRWDRRCRELRHAHGSACPDGYALLTPACTLATTFEQYGSA
jgi:hypothetical protein